mmetsp:Transcript_4670/g.16440  ORF Transcript_4670/g.16440 Transcript_4670/m.16440 type:complete len:89 (+) Transcript_4670:417-683(+)
MPPSEAILDAEAKRNEAVMALMVSRNEAQSAAAACASEADITARMECARLQAPILARELEEGLRRLRNIEDASVAAMEGVHHHVHDEL